MKKSEIFKAILAAIGRYLGCWLFLILAVEASLQITLLFVPRQELPLHWYAVPAVSVMMLGYLSCGVYLNHTVKHRLTEPHPMHNGIFQVAVNNLFSCFFWPVYYPFLLILIILNVVL